MLYKSHQYYTYSIINQQTITLFSNFVEFVFNADSSFEFGHVSHIVLVGTASANPEIHIDGSNFYDTNIKICSDISENGNNNSC